MKYFLSTPILTFENGDIYKVIHAENHWYVDKVETLELNHGTIDFKSILNETPFCTVVQSRLIQTIYDIMLFTPCFTLNMAWKYKIESDTNNIYFYYFFNNTNNDYVVIPPGKNPNTKYSFSISDKGIPFMKIIFENE